MNYALKMGLSEHPRKRAMAVVCTLTRSLTIYFLSAQAHKLNNILK